MIDPPAFNLVDAGVGVLLLMGLLGGLKRGLSGELSRVAAFLLAGGAVWKLAKPCATWAAGQFGTSENRGFIVSAAFIFFGALLLMWLTRKLLRTVMDFAFKGRLERIGGALCGLLRASVVAAFFLLLGSLAPQPELAALVAERSFFGRQVARHARPLYTDLLDRHPGLGLPAPTPADDGLGEMPADAGAALDDITLPALSDRTDE